MEVIAKTKHIRTSPRKLSLVADLVRRLPLTKALAILKNIPQRAALPLLKGLAQAKANALNNHSLEENSLIIKEVRIGKGPTLKRWNPVSRGRAHSIMKRTSHLEIVLEGTSLAPQKNLAPKMTPKKTTTKKNIRKN